VKLSLQHLLFLPLLALIQGGCASQSRALAIAQPLKVYELSEQQAPETDIKFVRSSKGKLEVQGPRVKGTRGQGLNVATSVHRILLAMGIDTEVTLEQMNRSHQVRIAFPQELSLTQRSQVRRVLQLIRN
jgi:hypothetical protein